MKLDERSERNLRGVHPDLVKVVREAAKDTPLQFTVIEGLRTLARQKQLVAKGASRTLRSRHLTGHAVDIAPVVGTIRWDWPLFYKLEDIIKSAARDVGVSIEWGGDWANFRDGPHWQLPWGKYPK